MNIDVTKFDFINSRSITEFYKNIKEINIPVLAKFFEFVIDINHDKIDIKYKMNNLFELFNNFIATGNYKIDYTLTKFGIDIKSYNGVLKNRTNRGYDIVISITILKQFLTSKFNINFELD